MIRVRIDDILTNSSAWQGKRNSVHRFKQICRWLNQTDKIEFMPTVLCTDIMNYPEAIEILKEGAADCTISPQLHGWEHIDYDALSVEDIDSHLDQSLEWFDKHISSIPTVWATPWGADSPKLRDAALRHGLKLEGVKGVPQIGDWLRTARTQDYFLPMAFGHWWDKGQAILKIVEIVNNGSYKDAAAARPDLF